MEAKELSGLGDLTVSHLREYILDMVEELALVAARRGDVHSARALQTCVSQILAERDA